jgi:glutathione synthase/RimK-type ligase-like ATP-grasp enzyme
MKKYRFAILKNENPDEHLEWLKACRESTHVIDVEVIDLSQDGWLERVKKSDCDCYLTRPPGAVGYFKQMYDERLYIIHAIMKKKIYPTFEEVLIYENKRMLAYWLEANQIPHAHTHVFYDRDEVDRFRETCSFPLVAKTAIGAAGSGIQILRSDAELKKYAARAFSQRGIARKWLPNLRKGKLRERARRRFTDIPAFLDYLKQRRRQGTIDPQRWHVILQEYIDVVEEWRTVRIGDSFFAHKKQRRGDIFSGGGGIDWDGPSSEILDFMKMVTDKRGFLCQAIDIFVDREQRLYTNELQCFFGFIHPEHQMIIDGIGGRYVRLGGEWRFEPGTFNRNNSYDLRVAHVVQLLEDDAL